MGANSPYKPESIGFVLSIAIVYVREHSTVIDSVTIR